MEYQGLLALAELIGKAALLTIAPMALVLLAADAGQHFTRSLRFARSQETEMDLHDLSVALAPEPIDGLHTYETSERVQALLPEGWSLAYEPAADFGSADRWRLCIHGRETRWAVSLLCDERYAVEQPHSVEGSFPCLSAATMHLVMQAQLAGEV